MTTDRGRRRPCQPVAPVVLFAVLVTLLLAGWSAHESLGNPMPAVSAAAHSPGHSGISLWLPRAQQPDRAGWNDLPAAVLAAGFLVAAGATGFAGSRRLGAALSSIPVSTSSRAPPARVSTS